MAESLILFDKVSKSFDKKEVLSNISFYIRKNEFLTLLGPSGCGKTTLLRILGGFETPTSGDVLFEGKSIVNVPPYKRRVNTVFQKYALFPHLTIAENIAFGLKIKKTDKNTIDKKVNEMLDLVGLPDVGDRMIDSISGGQQQRIALARALVNEPEVLLLDEPLGALDLKLRKGMQIELKRMQKQLGITFVYVTHDQEEAMTMSDTIVVLADGIIQQIGKPEDVYNEPRNSFVADFIGESNILDGIMKGDYRVFFCGREFECLDRGFNENESCKIVIRPEDIEVVAEIEGMLRGTVQSTVFMGVHYDIRMIADDGTPFRIHSTKKAEPGSRIGVRIGPDDIHVMERSVYDSPIL